MDLAFLVSDKLTLHTTYLYRLTLSPDSQAPSYSQSEQTTQSPVGISPQSAIDTGQYRRGSSHLAGPPITPSQYPSSSFNPHPLPQFSQYSQYSTGYMSQQFPASYQQQTQQHQQQSSDQQSPRLSMSQSIQQPQRQTYTPMSSTAHQFLPPTGSITQAEAEPGDNSDGGVPIGTSY